MAEYVYIQNYSNNGKLGISVSCFEQIVSIVTNKITGVSTSKNNQSNSNSIFKALGYRFNKPVSCEIVNNKVTINMQVVIQQGKNIEEVCSSIQQNVADELTTMVEMVPFQIKIKVVGIE